MYLVHSLIATPAPVAFATKERPRAYTIAHSIQPGPATLKYDCTFGALMVT